MTDGPRHRHFRHLSSLGDTGDVIIFSPRTITRRKVVRGAGSQGHKVTAGMGVWGRHLSHGGCGSTSRRLSGVRFTTECNMEVMGSL